ncbi:hypothetical protein Syun_020448 [Stephania yunnanensis]|uniref:Uncharacterized protein n=1 Tax=Stephania yunnanensis TaxID=152371 RepID=A0AAP0NRG4_9MAGN
MAASSDSDSGGCGGNNGVGRRDRGWRVAWCRSLGWISARFGANLADMVIAGGRSGTGGESAQWRWQMSDQGPTAIWWVTDAGGSGTRTPRSGRPK